MDMGYQKEIVIDGNTMIVRRAFYEEDGMTQLLLRDDDGNEEEITKRVPFMEVSRKADPITIAHAVCILDKELIKVLEECGVISKEEVFEGFRNCLLEMPSDEGMEEYWPWN